MTEMKEIKIPDTLLLGSATAATQVEGGDTNNNWYAWSLAGRVGNGESSLLGADHYNRFREDVELMSDLGHQCYRMSLEWSRIEPVRGQWSREAIEHYREEFQLLSDKGIAVLVTLHHFSCPQWFQEKGGWLAEDAVQCFLAFVEKSVAEFGDLVSQWCTINEPNVFANDSYMDGKYPPGSHGDMPAYFKVSRNLILAHLKSYKLIHRMREQLAFPGQTMVGFAHHLAYFQSSRPGLLAWLGRSLISHLFHEIYLKGFVEGVLLPPLGWGRPEGKGRFCDFLGINYYSRHIITPSLNPGNLFGTIDFRPGLSESEKTDLGWEIYPQGLAEVLTPVWKRYRLPIYITENGLADADDSRREAFIVAHLKVLVELIASGVDIRRYFHWSFLDNLEWNDGYGPRFGLVEVDYQTMERRVRPSARAYERICKNRVLEGGGNDS